jgi:hypothetical protein
MVMFTKVLPLTAIMLVFWACQLQADVVHSTWVGGEWGLWDDASNWRPWGVPDNEDFAITIDSDSVGEEEVYIQLQHDLTLNQLVCVGDVMLYWKQYRLELTLKDENGLTNHAEFLFDGNIRLNGNLHNAADAQMQIRDDLEVWNGEVRNEGFMLITYGGRFFAEREFYNSGTIQMYQVQCTSNRNFINGDKGVIKGAGTIHSKLDMQNQGAIYAEGGGLVLHAGRTITNSGVLGNMPNSSLTLTPFDVNNFGTIEVNAGDGVTFDCNMVNEPNGVVKLLGGTLAGTMITQKAGATFEGFGNITGNVVIEPNAVIKLTGPTNIVGDLTIEEGATLDISDGTVLVTGLTTCNGGTIRTYHGTIIMQGGESGDICRRILVD